MKKSELKKYISEALTPDEASKVEPKYKETYAAMIRGKGPLKLKKYDNPDKVVLGRVINNLKESTRRTNERLEVAIKEVFSEKQRKYMCVMAQPGAKRPKGLSKADAKEMCADTKISKKMNEGDLDIGHQDDEPRMIKKDIYNMGKYAMELYKKLDQYDDIEGEVDFPHWWQSKLTKAKSMLQSAYDYLDGEEKINQIDAIMEEDELTKSEKKKLKKVSSQLKKSVKAHDKQSKIIDKAISEIYGRKISDAETASVYDRMKGDINKRKKIFGKFASRPYARLNPRDQKIVQDIVAKMKKGKNIKETGQEISKQNMKGYKEKNKSRLEELVKAALMGPVKEANAYIMAADKARDAGKKEFEFPEGSGKMHPVKIKANIDEASKAGKLRIPKDIEKLLQDAHGDFVAGKIDGIELGERLDRILNNPQGPDPSKYGPVNFTVDMDLDEVELPQNVKTLANQEVKDAPSMAKAMLDFYNQIKEKETIDFSQNPVFKIVLPKLQALAKKAKVNENKSLSERILKELRGNINEMAGEDLELKSLAKKFIPILKKYGMKVDYETDTKSIEMKPKAGPQGVPAKLLIRKQDDGKGGQFGMLTVAVYWLELVSAKNDKRLGLKELDFVPPSPQTYDIADEMANKMYKELMAVVPKGEFDSIAPPKMNRWGNYLIHFRLKK